MVEDYIDNLQAPGRGEWRRWSFGGKEETEALRRKIILGDVSDIYIKY